MESERMEKSKSKMRFFLLYDRGETGEEEKWDVGFSTLTNKYSSIQIGEKRDENKLNDTFALM